MIRTAVSSFVAAGCGMLFGLGLLLSGMTDTLKVQGFLDVFGDWNAQLGFVMLGAIPPMAVAWALIRRRGRALIGTPAPEPARGPVDRALILGAILFGAGWALAGFCPAPALTSLSFGGAPSAIFTVAMIAGMALARLGPLRPTTLQAAE